MHHINYSANAAAAAAAAAATAAAAAAGDGTNPLPQPIQGIPGSIFHHQPQLPAMGQWLIPPPVQDVNLGQQQGQVPPQTLFKTFKDECADCFIERDELYMFSCGHYPYCTQCMKLMSIQTPGALNCPACQQQVSDVRRVYRVVKVSPNPAQN